MWKNYGMSWTSYKATKSITFCIRQQLEQVSRDKEILEKKLKLLEIEYNKLHERHIASQQNIYNNNHNLPERDIEADKKQICYIKRFNYNESENDIPNGVQVVY